MTKSAPEIPKELIDFIQVHSAGPYADRFEAVLAEAFYRHRLFLSATNLKMLVGGGSLSTAQKAVETFKASLHERLNYSIDLGGTVPQEISAKFADALDGFWGFARTEAKTEWERERAEVNLARDAALEQQQSAKVQLIEALSNAEVMERELVQVRLEREQLVAHTRELEVSAVSQQERLDATARAEIHANSQVTQLQNQLGEQAERSERRAAEMAELAKVEQHEARKQHMLQLDAVRTQSKADLERAAAATADLQVRLTEISAARAAGEATSSRLVEDLRALSSGKVALESEARRLEAVLADIRGQLATQTALLEASRSQTVDTAGLLEWLHQLHQVDPAAIPPADARWGDSTAEGRVARAVTQLLARPVQANPVSPRESCVVGVAAQRPSRARS